MISIVSKEMEMTNEAQMMFLNNTKEMEQSKSLIVAAITNEAHNRTFAMFFSLEHLVQVGHCVAFGHVYTSNVLICLAPTRIATIQSGSRRISH